MSAWTELPILSIPQAAILAVAATACVWDLRTRRIPNALTLGGSLLAFAYYGATGGGPGLGASALGWLAGIALFAPVFLLRGMGAGDVKLLAALGAWFGPTATLALAATTAIAGGLVALLVVLWHGALRPTLRNTWLLVCHWRIAGFRALPEVSLDDPRRLRLPYAVPIVLGTVTTLWLWQ